MKYLGESTVKSILQKNPQITSILEFLEIVDYSCLEGIQGLAEKKIEQVIKNIEKVEQIVEEQPLLFLQALSVVPNLGESVITKIFEKMTI